ncbi:hypothetical protein ABIB25_005909 [Nakamurella sp. UYEF19]|uniref:hypothetical protein n=1 Tax=Nakamurella sp. UYEF19 TaxID=1756392 RepID=UPI0033984EE3
MTATTSSKQRGPDPQSTRLDPADQAERPGTIPWELLGASDYRNELTDLGTWLEWLVPTYRIPPSVIPPCWFLHPGLIEELGHLWTGWRVTRHADSGVGMVGLDWDGHRERATSRLRELVATAGCNGTNHSPKPGPALNRDEELWETHLKTDAESRKRKSTERAIRSSAEEVLVKAEQRDELAVDILADVATDPAHPTAAEIDQGAMALEKSSWVAAAEAQRRGRDTRTHIGNAASESLLTTALVTARDEVLTRIAAGCDPAELEAAIRRWQAAATSAVPTDDALRRAAATNVGRSTAANHLASARFRHDVATMLNPTATT